MKRLIAAILAVVLTMAMVVPVSAAGKPWYEDAMNKAIELGFLDTSANPNATASRYDIVEALWRLDGKKSAPSANFTDVDELHAPAINWAAANNLVAGYGNGYFGGNDNVTREQMAVILARYVNYCGDYQQPYNSIFVDAGFVDENEIASWAKDSLNWAVWVGLFVGTPNMRLVPKGELKISELATVVNRTYTVFVQPVLAGGEIDPDIYRVPWFYLPFANLGEKYGWESYLVYDVYGSDFYLTKTIPNEAQRVFCVNHYYGSMKYSVYFTEHVDSAIIGLDDIENVSQQAALDFVQKHIY